MKPDWDDLGEKYENSKKVLIGDVDCTEDANKDLCEAQGVKGYPTIKYYNPGDREGEVYEGERTLAALKKFVKTLGPPCSPSHLNKCTAAQKEELQGYLTKPATELQETIETMATELKEKEAAHEALMKSLQEQFQESESALTKLKADNGPKVKLMKAALANLTAVAEEAGAESAKEEL